MLCIEVKMCVLMRRREVRLGREERMVFMFFPSSCRDESIEFEDE